MLPAYFFKSLPGKLGVKCYLGKMKFDDGILASKYEFLVFEVVLILTGIFVFYCNNSLTLCVFYLILVQL